MCSRLQKPPWLLGFFCLFLIFLAGCSRSFLCCSLLLSCWLFAVSDCFWSFIVLHSWLLLVVRLLMIVVDCCFLFVPCCRLLLIVDDWWLVLIVYYFWLLLMDVDCCWLLRLSLIVIDCCFLLIAVDCCWLLMIVDDCWWLLMIVDDGWWWLISVGHQTNVHNLLVQLYPFSFFCFSCTTAYFTLWRGCFPLGFHQSPQSSHSCQLASFPLWRRCFPLGLHQSPLLVPFLLLGFGLLDLADGFVWTLVALLHVFV